MVWQPARRRIERLESAAKCESTDRLIRRGAPILALAGSRAAWLQLTGGNRLETILKSATLARPTPVWIVAKAASELSVLAVDAGRIAARTESGIRLLTAGGRVLQDLPVRASAAALSRNRLAVRTRDAVEVYDTGSGGLTDHFVAAKGVRLQDLEGDILVTASGNTFTLRRLGDRRTSTIRVNRTTLARLEPAGLFLRPGPAAWRLCRCAKFCGGSALPNDRDREP
jgi:hypothetical protein